MLWIVVLLMFCLPTVESEECKESEIIVGRLGEELVLNFPLSDIRDEYNNYNFKRYGKKYETNIQDLKKESGIRFKKKMDSFTEQIIFKDGKPTNHLSSSLTEIFMTNDSFLVKKRELHEEDVGIYWVNFRSIHLGQKALIIAGEPTIKGRSPPNPILNADDDYSTILQLECHSVSTSIGDCQLYNSMYIMWYKNGMRMTELDPTLSQINVTVDHNGGNFTCLATEYPPCYHRLQTTKHYDVLNIEECDNVYESETFIVKPQYGPSDVKLEPDQREITVNENDDLKVRCSAKCHPKCDVKWEKDCQDLESNDLVTITKSMFGSDLKIVNISSSDEGFYSCLVSNTHGEAKKNFTLSVRKPETKVLMSVKMNIGCIITVSVGIAICIIVCVIVAVIVIMVIKKIQKENNTIYNEAPEESLTEEHESIYLTPVLRQVEPPAETFRLITDEHIYEPIELRQKEPLPETSKLITDESVYDTIDGSYETLDGSFETIDGSYGWSRVNHCQKHQKTIIPGMVDRKGS